MAIKVVGVAEAALGGQADPLLNDRQVSECTGVPAGTLRWWRHGGHDGPKWFRLGPRAVRYKQSDVLAWIEASYNRDNRV